MSEKKRTLMTSAQKAKVALEAVKGLVSRKLAHNIKHKLSAQACCDNKRLTVTA
jgi:hypothetical protein